jgi:alpha-L-fucosidase 2
MSLWYRQPAAVWTEALPVGNGRLGAMVFGGAPADRLQLNEESVWAGFPRDRNNAAALEALPEVRRLLFEGRNQEAAALAERTMLAIPRRVDSYQPLGDLHLTLNHAAEPAGYRRALDLDSGIATVTYAVDGVSYERQVFASAVDQVVVARLSCDRSGTLGLGTSLRRERDAESGVEGTDLTLAGQCNSDPAGVRFAARVRLLAEGAGARVTTSADEVHVEGADAITVLVAGHSDFPRPGMAPELDPAAACRRTLQAAAEKGYAALRADHVADYQRLFRRVSFWLGSAGEASASGDRRDDRPIDERLAGVGTEGADEPALVALQFQVNRYQLIAASRPGGLPSNLQGIWNEKLAAPWNSDYHPNINLQMNYWPADAAALSECHQPLFDWLERTIVPRGRVTARKTYGCRGWVLHHVSDQFGCTEPMDGIWGLWPVGGAWTVRHSWDHYLYTLDRSFLRDRAWPMLREAARFLLDFLCTAPEGTPVAGKLVTNPSHSPENAFRKPDGTLSKFTYAATMDLMIAHDLFTNCLEALAVLGDDAGRGADELRAELEGALSTLAALQISARDGRLQEWVEDYDEPEPGHRHISHLYGVYPAHQITPEGTPDLANAAAKSLERKLAAGYNAQAWSLHWMACVWARLGQGERANQALMRSLRDHTFPNLFVNAHGNAQLGDALGFAAAVCEMLVQSRYRPMTGTTALHLLPALPAAWPSGHLNGLRTRGGFEVDLAWQEGRLTHATLRATHDVQCVARTGTDDPLRLDGAVAAPEANGLVRFQARAGQTYTLTPQ